MTKPENLYVIIADYGGWAQTRICLESLRKNDYRCFTILVVDHGLGEQTGRALQADFPEVRHVRGDPALWWAGATNLGIRKARERGADAVILLNNDCYVEPDTISILVGHARQNDLVVVAPLQRNAVNGHLLTNLAASCFLLGFPTFPIPGQIGLNPGEHRLVSTRLILGGRGVFIPTALFDDVGLFDEARFPHYGADHDFYLRCRSHGIPLYLATDAFVNVDDSRTTSAANTGRLGFREFLATLTGRRSHRNIRDLEMLFRRHYPVKGMHHLGLILNLARYFVVYIIRRAHHLLSPARVRN